MLELLMVVAILGILGSLALPSFQGLINSNRLTSVANDFLAGTMSARSEAVRRARRAVICKSGNGSSCDDGLTWSAGWIVFADDNEDNQLTAGEQVLRVFQGSDQVTTTPDAAFANRISFSGRGAILQGSGIIKLCISGQTERQLELRSTGRTSILRGGACS